jgi:uncharacterized protein (TIGR02145 family)
MKIEMKLLFLALMVLFVGCSNDAVSSHDVIPIAGDISSSAVQPSSGSEKPVVQNSSSSAENFSSAEESSSSSSESLSSSSESAGSSSSSEQESSSSSVLEVKSSSSSSLVLIYGEMTDERDGQVYKTIYVEGFEQIWMIENLNYAYLQPTAELDSSSMCVWDCVYGRFYLWSAAVDSAALFSDAMKGCGYFESSVERQKCPDNKNVRGVCPEGWRLPTYEDYGRLMQWRSEPSINFNETQLQEHWSNVEIDLFTSSRFWVLVYAGQFYGTVDGWDPHRVTFYPQDLYDEDKRNFNAVRCVRDKEIEE